VSNDEISRILAIIAHYGKPAIVNSVQRPRQDGVELLLLVKLYHDNFIRVFLYIMILQNFSIILIELDIFITQYRGSGSYA